MAEFERRAAEARARAVEETHDLTVDDDQMLELFTDCVTPYLLDGIRDFYGPPEVDEWLSGAKERGLITEEADGSTTLTPQGWMSVKLPSPMITAALPAPKRRQRKRR